jgi:hypothetical protein
VTAAQPTAYRVAERLPAWAFPLVTSASLLLGAVVVIRGASAFVVPNDSDLRGIFFKSVDHVLNGSPLHIYAARSDPPLTDNPNDDPPIIVFLLAPFVAIAKGVGLESNLRGEVVLVTLCFIILVPILGWLVVSAIDRLNPGLSPRQRLAAYALVTLSPLVWLCFSPWGHIEQPLMIGLLIATVLALQAGRELLAGVLGGLTLLTGLTAAFPLLALATLLYASGQLRSLWRSAGLAVLILAVGVAPFLLADQHNTAYSLLTFRPGRAIGGNSIWVLVNFDRPSDLASLIRRLDTPAEALVCIAAGYAAATRLRMSVRSVDVWAILTIGALALPMLVKVNWPYYYAAPFVLMLIWELGALRDRADTPRWPVLSIGYLIVASTLGQYIGMASIGLGDRVITGIAEFTVMLGFAAAIWYQLETRAPRDQPVPATSG